MEESEHRKNLVEIINGSSTTFLRNERVFIKHKGLNDLVDYELIYNHNLEYARKKGLPTKEEVLEELNDGDIWTKHDENKIQETERFLESLKNNKSNVYLDSALKKVEEQIENTELELNALMMKKEELVSNSAETYATNRANDYYIVNSFYKDKEHKDLLFTQEEYEYLDRTRLQEVIALYSKFSKRFSEDSIQYLVLQDFYKVYYSMSESSMDFFGKAALELTNFQLNLFLYTRIFKNIFENVENIPDKIKNNPKQLLDFASSSKTREEVKSKIDKDGSGGTIVGATKEDMDAMGLSTEGGDTLSDAAKKKGGQLTMADLMKMNGV